MSIKLSSYDESSFTEGQITDLIKGTTGIDAEGIKKDWVDIKNDNAGTADRIVRTTNSIIDKTTGGVDAKIKSINDTLEKNTINKRSIITRSRNSVLQFPIYCTRSIPYNEAHIISKLFERVYCSFVQTALAQNPVVDEEEVNNLLFLQKFHTNLQESTELELYNEFYEPIDDVDAIIKESVYHSEWVSPTMNVEFRIAAPTEDLIKENSRLINEPLSGLRYLLEDGVKAKDMVRDKNEVRTDISTGQVKLSAKDIEDIALNNANLTSMQAEYYGKSATEIKKEIEARESDPDKVDELYKKALFLKDVAKEKVDKAAEDFKSKVRDGKAPGYKFDGHSYIMASTKHSQSTVKSNEMRPPIDTPKMLRDADIKKINGMLPYTMETTFRVRNKANDVAYDVHFIIGVKTVLHPINVTDLQDDLQELVTGTMKGLQKVRYKTGEIKFMDYVFNFKGLKKDAAKRVDYNKRWLNSLKRMADYEKLNGAAYKALTQYPYDLNVPVPNGTIILSKSDVTTLISTTGIDLEQVSNAKRLAKSLFLIAVAIVDPSAGTMKVLFPDNDNDWDVQSLASIDSELAKTDNSQIMRELNRMVNK